MSDLPALLSPVFIGPAEDSFSPRGAWPALYGRQQQGASLLEVLVAIVLMSFAMLGMAGMQAYSVAAHRNAAYRSVAASLSSELAEQLRLNPSGLIAGHYDIAMLTDSGVPAAAACAYPSCVTPQQRAASDLSYFLPRVRRDLPSGGVVLARPDPAKPEAHLWMLWKEPQVLFKAGASGGEPTEIDSDNCPTAVRSQQPLPRCFYLKVNL